MVDRKDRPEAPTEHAHENEHRRQIAERANAALNKDGTNAATGPVRFKSYAVAALTGALAASAWSGALIYVEDEAGGATLAFSDGTNWRRVQDRAVVS